MSVINHKGFDKVDSNDSAATFPAVSPAVCELKTHPAYFSSSHISGSYDCSEEKKKTQFIFLRKK